MILEFVCGCPDAADPMGPQGIDWISIWDPPVYRTSYLCDVVSSYDFDSGALLDMICGGDCFQQKDCEEDPILPGNPDFTCACN